MASALHLLLLLLLCSVGSSQAGLRIFNLHAIDLPSDFFGTTDGYVKVFVGSSSLGQTSVAKNQVNPRWSEEFHHVSALQDDILRVEVHDEDLIFDDLVGTCQRQLQLGTHHLECYLEEGGVLNYSYSLDSQ